MRAFLVIGFLAAVAALVALVAGSHQPQPLSTFVLVLVLLPLGYGTFSYIAHLAMEADAKGMDRLKTPAPCIGGPLDGHQFPLPSLDARLWVPKHDTQATWAGMAPPDGQGYSGFYAPIPDKHGEGPYRLALVWTDWH